ncbi:MAG TPA: AmmeMemoRadiSam system radical SAM enzyme, partial [Candidatus Ozemobacteraceae bacterium]|nr:AmmeMemoRadiSam system radical SAM enzyme [Candidatus Ozemobacteraceae bacterium]
RCRIAEGRRGRCLGRGREGGTLRLYNYAVVAAANSDPIEKKPLYHFFPGSSILSVGTFGCNLHCRFCQNCDLSQEIQPGEEVLPERLVAVASSHRGNIGVAFTYNEPGIWYEYVVDTAPLLRARGHQVVLVTNGYLEPEPWERLCLVADAMNIDLKAYTDEFYRDVCRGALSPVLANIATAVNKGVHVELTHLVITGLNDRPDDFVRLVEWVAQLDERIPLHLSRYFPRFHETAPATDPALLEEFRRIAARRLRYVYLGNVDTEEGNDTRCPNCGKVWIQRSGYDVSVKHEGPVCVCGQQKHLRMGKSRHV